VDRSNSPLMMVLAQSSGQNTTAPTPGPNDCDLFEAGGVYFSYLDARTPNEVQFFTFADIPGTIPNLYLTNNAWTGTDFQVTEGTVEVSST